MARAKATRAGKVVPPLNGSTNGWAEAEEMAANWMRSHGFRDARRTPAGADGGVDVVARKAVAQVKHHAKPVGIAEIQRIYGIATGRGVKALFFSRNGYTQQAMAWARQHDVQCYRYSPVQRVA